MENTGETKSWPELSHLILSRLAHKCIPFSISSLVEWVLFLPEEELYAEPDDDDDLEVEEGALDLDLELVVLDGGEHAQAQAQEDDHKAEKEFRRSGTAAEVSKSDGDGSRIYMTKWISDLFQKCKIDPLAHIRTGLHRISEQR